MANVGICANVAGDRRAAIACNRYSAPEAMLRWFDLIGGQACSEFAFSA